MPADLQEKSKGGGVEKSLTKTWNVELWNEQRTKEGEQKADKEPIIDINHRKRQTNRSTSS
jgi:hypothetical protein